MTEKQHLLLYLIATYPFLREIYQLVKVFDRANFPAEVSMNLEPLLRQGLIEVDRLFENKTPASYRVTNKGLEYLNEAVRFESLVEYVKTMENPTQILKALKV